MRSAFFSFVILTLAAAPAVAATKVAVPAKTEMKLVSDSVVVSTVAVNPGDELDFHVSDPVVVDGWVVIPAGAKAVGHVVSGGGMEMKTNLFGGSVKPRNTVYALDYVTSADGGKIKLDGTPASPPITNQVEVHGWFGHKAAGGIGLLNKGTVVPAEVDHLVHVTATEKASASGGYDE